MNTNLLINLATILMSLAAAWAVAKYRIDRLERDREKDGENFQRTIGSIEARIADVDGRYRDNTGSLFQRSDENRQAGGILESRVSALEAVLDPGRVHESNRKQGAFEASTETRLLRVEQDQRRVEDHFIKHIQRGRKSK